MKVFKKSNTKTPNMNILKSTQYQHQAITKISKVPNRYQDQGGKYVQSSNHTNPNQTKFPLSFERKNKRDPRQIFFFSNLNNVHK